MLSHITRQGAIALHHSVERLEAGSDRFKYLSRAEVNRGEHAFGPGLRRIMLHATILGIVVLATVMTAIAE